jgi:1,4-dihydroxy-2-naphthoyl-CoA synthase
VANAFRNNEGRWLWVPAFAGTTMSEERFVTQPLLIEHDDGVDRVTLNRPDSLNALDPGMIDALNAYFGSLQRNRSTRVVVLYIRR